MANKLIHDTPEKKARAVQIARAKSKAKTKNITVDADIVSALNSVCDELENEFGFRPTISQSLRYMIKVMT